MKKQLIYLGPAGVPVSCERRDTISGLRKVHELGLNAMEVEFVQGVRMSNNIAKKVGEEAEKLNIKLSVHAPYFINLCNPEKVEASIKRILDSCERASYMKAKVVVFHPGYYGNLSKEDAFDMVKENIERIVEIIEDNNWEVFLGLETTGKHSQFGTLDEIMKIVKKEKRCVPVIDFAHIYARNLGKIDYGKIFDELSKLKIDFIHSHFSGIEFTEKGEKRHLPIDTGKPDFKELAKEILKRKINIAIISESPILEQDSLKMKEIFESLGYSF